jgi:hypothetical protein
MNLAAGKSTLEGRVHEHPRSSDQVPLLHWQGRRRQDRTCLVSEARDHFVVLDTAPTGHMLLDTTGPYHRQTVASFSKQHAGRIVTPLMRLRAPDYTRILLVSLAETTPVSEAAQLQSDLARAGMEPYAWLINSTFAAACSPWSGQARRSSPPLTLAPRFEAERSRPASRTIVGSRDQHVPGSLRCWDCPSRDWLGRHRNHRRRTHRGVRRQRPPSMASTRSSPSTSRKRKNSTHCSSPEDHTGPSSWARSTFHSGRLGMVAGAPVLTLPARRRST